MSRHERLLNTPTLRWDYAVDRLFNNRNVPAEITEAIFEFVDGEITKEQFDEVMS